MLQKFFKPLFYRGIAVCLILLLGAVFEHCNARSSWPDPRTPNHIQSINLSAFVGGANIKVGEIQLTSITDDSKLKLDAFAKAWNPVPWQDGFNFLLNGNNEPFAATLEQNVKSNIKKKWHAIKDRIAAETEMITACRRKPENCLSIGARRFLAISRSAGRLNGLAQIGEVNRAVNLAIRPESDSAQYGMADYWASPLESLTSGAGDCEDYAVAKYAILLGLGVSKQNLRLVIVRDARLKQYHAVVSVRVGDHWRLLDNRTFVMLSDEDARTYRPLFVLGLHTYRVVNWGFSNLAEYKKSDWPPLSGSAIGSIFFD